MTSSDSALHTDKGMAAVAAGDEPTAVRFFQEALATDPLNYDAYFQLGQLLLRQARYEEAVDIFTRLERKLPRDTEVKLQLADALGAMGGQGSTLPLLTAAVKLTPDDPKVALRCVHEYLAAGKTARGLRMLKAFIKRNPHNVDALAELGWLHLNQGRVDRARAVFEDCLRRMPGHRKAQAGVNRLVQEGETPKDGANGSATRSSGPGLAEAARALAQRDPEQAIEILEAHREYRPSDEVNMLLGIAYRDAQRLDQAVEQFQALLNSPSERTLARYQLALTFNGLARYTQARDLLRDALLEDPDFPEAYQELALALTGLNDIPGAVKAYEHALRGGAENEQVFLGLASLHMEQGNYEAAGAVAADCLERYPRCSRAHALLAHLSLVYQDWETAETAARFALESEPESALGHKYLAISLWQLGRQDDARRILKQLKRQIPDDRMLIPFYQAAGVGD